MTRARLQAPALRIKAACSCIFSPMQAFQPVRQKLLCPEGKNCPDAVSLPMLYLIRSPTKENNASMRRQRCESVFVARAKTHKMMGKPKEQFWSQSCPDEHGNASLAGKHKPKQRRRHDFADSQKTQKVSEGKSWGRSRWQTPFRSSRGTESRPTDPPLRGAS